jgi:hypothetical protein
VVLWASVGRAHKNTAIISAFFIFKLLPNWDSYCRVGQGQLFFAPQFENSISGHFVQPFLSYE